MKKILLMIVGLWLVGAGGIVAAADYVIDDFGSQITINKDKSLTVKETIIANFLTDKHGIFRIIPYIYSAKGKTIEVNLRIEGVTDETGKEWEWEVENFNQSKKIKIGDAQKTIQGRQIYKIKYRVTKVLQDYGEGPELYWNVTGSEWDTTIGKVNANVVSEWAKVEKSECFAGVVRSQEKNCRVSGGDFESGEVLGSGKDMTIVVQLSKNNGLVGLSKVEELREMIRDNWGYGVATIPLLVAIGLWYWRGRDKKYLTENVFYKPESKTEKTVGLWDRPHLPLVYGTINGLTPAGLGTIMDEKVDTKDIVAEIVELARLRVIRIEKTEKKGMLGIMNRNYKLTKLTDNKIELNDYQTYLKESLFGNKSEVMISELRDKFYVHLEPFRKKVYAEMKKIGAMEDDPRTMVKKYSGLMVLINFGAFMAVGKYWNTTGNFGPMGWLWVQGLMSLMIMRYMPRKTAWGYSLHRQAIGLRYYLNVGKWREEIAEKRLFVDEILPLAVALGVVGKLAHDMEVLAMEPPEYFGGVGIQTFAGDMGHFNSVMAGGLTSAPTKYSGSGSWSGGSGFGGGHSGGGFGGGGGGSW